MPTRSSGTPPPPRRPASAQSNRSTGAGASKSTPKANTGAGSQSVPSISISPAPTLTSSDRSGAGYHATTSTLPHESINERTIPSRLPPGSTVSPASTSNAHSQAAQAVANPSFHDPMPSALNAAATTLNPSAEPGVEHAPNATRKISASSLPIQNTMSPS